MNRRIVPCAEDTCAALSTALIVSYGEPDEQGQVIRALVPTCEDHRNGLFAREWHLVRHLLRIDPPRLITGAVATDGWLDLANVDRCDKCYAQADR